MALDDFARQVGIAISNPSLLRRALTHRSYLNEHPDTLEDNERLEFLGDAALDFITAAWLYNRYPEMDEGALTRLRSSLVRTEQLAAFAREMRLGESVLLGKGEEASGGRDRDALLCDTFEALIGAVFLDSGLATVIKFMQPRLARAAEVVLQDESLLDPRSKLQIWAQAAKGETPRYQTVDTFGPDHEREFLIEVSIGDELRGRGVGRSKQEAAQKAAADVLSKIGEI
ncbi:MAG: ribonuclease III [Anaerolineales bacterium]